VTRTRKLANIAFFDLSLENSNRRVGHCCKSFVAKPFCLFSCAVMFISQHMPPISSDDAEEADLVFVDVLAPSFLFPASVQHKDLVKECVSKLKLSSDRQLKVKKKKTKKKKKKKSSLLFFMCSDTLSAVLLN
jgi:hypothetical protein